MAGGRGAAELVLARDATHALPVGRREVHVHCVAGSVWITCQGDPEDHVLAAGQVFRAARPGKLVMLALEPGRVRVVAPPRQPATRPVRATRAA